MMYQLRISVPHSLCGTGVALRQGSLLRFQLLPQGHAATLSRTAAH